MMIKYLSFLILCAMQMSFAQSKISGHITTHDQERIPFASVIVENTVKGTSADENGYFELNNLAPGDYKIKVSFVGYKSLTKSVTLTGDEQITLSFQLIADSELQEVEIFGNRFKHPDKIEALTRLPLAPYEQIQSIS